MPQSFSNSPAAPISVTAETMASAPGIAGRSNNEASALVLALAALGAVKLSVSSAQFLASLGQFLIGPGAPGGHNETAADWVQIALLAMFAFAMRRSFARPSGGWTAIGMSALLVPFGGAVALAVFTLTFRVVGAGFTYSTPVGPAAAMLAAWSSAALYAVLAEWIFRGALIDALMADGGSEARIIAVSAFAWGLTAAGFGSPLLQIILQFLFGLVFGLVRLRSGRLVYAMALHVGYSLALNGFLTSP